MALILRLPSPRRNLVVICAQKGTQILLSVDLLDYFSETHGVWTTRISILERADTQTIAE